MDKVSVPYLLPFFQSSSKVMADREKKRGGQKYKSEYLDNENSFLHEIKSIFHSFGGLSFGGKIKNSGHKLYKRSLKQLENYCTY